jgi:hypothetical protein
MGTPDAANCRVAEMLQARRIPPGPIVRRDFCVAKLLQVRNNFVGTESELMYVKLAAESRGFNATEVEL